MEQASIGSGGSIDTTEWYLCASRNKALALSFAPSSPTSGTTAVTLSPFLTTNLVAPSHHGIFPRMSTHVFVSDVPLLTTTSIVFTAVSRAR